MQDNVVIHTNKGCPCVIGNNVSIGHNATIHGAIIEDNCLIGMGAVLLDGCKISKGSLVAAGAVVPQGMVIGTRSLVMGCPAKVVTEVDDVHYKSIIDLIGKDVLGISDEVIKQLNNISVQNAKNKLVESKAINE
mgnify:CR=1 FL=1